MYSIEQYNKETIRLVNSLVIKVHHIAIAMNRAIAHKYDTLITDDIRQWKYYLNLSGQPHWSNNTVKIYVMETGTVEELTKDLLDKNTYTRAELITNGIAYKELLNQYPDDILYIHGCMYPIDIETAINADDGEILSYNKTLIEDNEYMLIPKLQAHIKEFLHRWYLPEYMIADELYPALILGTLYANLPLKIMNIRLDNVHTNNAHSFHLEHFFRSNFDIADEVTILKKETIFWLYKNLPTIRKNIGSQGALNLLINKVLTTNDIGIGVYDLVSPLPTLNDKADATKSGITNKSLVAYTRGLNKYYVINNDKMFSLEDTVTREILYANVKDKPTQGQYQMEYLIKNVEDAVANNFISNQRTKILELSTYQIFKQSGIDIFKFVLDNLVYNIKTNRINYIIDWVDPNTNITYMLNGKGSLIIILKLLGCIANSKNIKLGKMYYDFVLPGNKKLLTARYRWMLQDGYTDKIIRILEDCYPSQIMQYNGPTEFKRYLTAVNNFFEFIWTLDSNAENVMVSAAIKQLMWKVLINGYYDLAEGEDDIDVDEALINNDIDFRIAGEYNYHEALRSLLRSFTGIDINEYVFITDLNKQIQSFVNKLTSYTTQALTTDTGENSIFLKYNNIGLFNLGNPIVSATGAELNPFAEYTPMVDCYADNITGLLQTSILNNIECDIISTDYSIASTLYETYHSELEHILSPTFTAQEIYEDVYCMSKRIMYGRIDNVVTEFIPVDNKPFKLKTGVSDVGVANSFVANETSISIAEDTRTDEMLILAEIKEYISNIDGPEAIITDVTEVF